MTSAVDAMLEANAEYVRGLEPRAIRPLGDCRLALVTCMDPRIVPLVAFGLDQGSAFVIRNAGGRTREALRSLVVSERMAGTNEIAVVHHTRCAMLGLSNDDVRARVKRDLGADASQLDVQGFADLEESVRDDVAFLRASPLIARTTVIRGMVFDVDTGRLTEVSTGAAPVRPGAAAGSL
ncbi:MAG TPA: carbonic anhydrase [Gemmatimonadales bacterium]|nr:carbonic anhydrase [Gemmatimonadales bacterium]